MVSRNSSSIVIGYESALEFWRKAWLAGNGSAGDLLGQPFPDDLLFELRDDPASLASYPSVEPVVGFEETGASRLANLLELSSPVQVVADQVGRRRRYEGVVSRAWRHCLPEGLLAHVEDNIYVCAPELAFIQVASTLGYSELIDLAYELCGDYVILGSKLHEGRHWEGGRGMSTPARLRAVCGIFKEFYGRAAAIWAADAALANSWSPMESRLAALLTMPRTHGGYGCAGAALNERIYLDGELAEIAGRGYVVPDILFKKANICYEYQGKQHDGVSNRRGDDAKGNVLLMKGIETVRIWDEKLFDITCMDAVAAHLCEALGIRRRPESERMRSRREDLIDAFKASSRRVKKA